MHGTVIIFMVLEVGGRGRLAPESEEKDRTVIIFIVLEVGGRGAAASRVARNS